MDTVSPFVRIVVLSFDGSAMTSACLDSLRALDYPQDRYEVFVVDNASIDDSVEMIRRDHPWVTLREEWQNHGFAGGCNLGMRDLPAGIDYVALLNNDATVDPQWLTALVAAAKGNPKVGAVAAKMLFADRFRGVAVTTPVIPHPKLPRFSVGVKVLGVRVDGVARWDDIAWGEGWLTLPIIDSPDESPALYSLRPAEVRVLDEPGQPAPQVISLLLSAPTDRIVTLDSGLGPTQVTVTATPTWFDTTLTPDAFDVINNVGSHLFEGGFGGDRGFLERDHGQYETAADIFAWCGGAVLLRRAFLAEVGLFDERFFVYYEDTDLSWRGRMLGWTYRYEPAAVVRHQHSASSGTGSDVFLFHTTRNRLLVLTKLAPWKMAARAVAIECRYELSYLKTEVIKPILRIGRPAPRRSALQKRVLESYARLLPVMIRDRRSLRRQRKVSDRELVAWMVKK
jgi:GT2 family glycosyltransferase